MPDFEEFPLVIGWELTLACNLRCRHCGSTAGLPRPRELTCEEALAICDQLPELLVFEVDFTGGEPFANPHWYQIARRLRDLKIRTHLITNGLLLGPDTIAQIKETGISRVGVSLDGLEETHDYIRDHLGLFKQVLAGIEELHRAGVPVAAITTVNALNVRQLPSLFGLLQSLGVEIWQFQPIFPLGRAKNSRDLALSDSDYMQLGGFTRDYYDPSGRITPLVSPGDSFGYYTEMDRREPGWGGCSAGIAACGIMSDGRVKGCLSMPDSLAEGDLRHRALWDIWFDPDAFAYNRTFSRADLGTNCSRCDRAERCLGGCSSMSVACTGQMHNDPYCLYRMTRKQVEAAQA